MNELHHEELGSLLAGELWMFEILGHEGFDHGVFIRGQSDAEKLKENCAKHEGNWRQVGGTYVIDLRSTFWVFSFLNLV